METNKIQELWKGISSDFPAKTKEELWVLIYKKSKSAMNKIISISIVSGLTNLGLIVFLVYTSLHRRNDFLYLANNGLLLLIASILFIFLLIYLKKIKAVDNANLPLKQMLSHKIEILDRSNKTKVSFFAIPVLYVLICLSIHVYFENKSMVEVLKNEESIAGLIVGLPIGLAVSYFASARIKKYQRRKLEFLKTLFVELKETEKQ